MTDEPRILDAVRRELDEAHTVLPTKEATRRLLERYVTELVLWGRRMHLVGKGNPERTIPAQVKDSLVMLRCAEDVLAEQTGRRNMRVKVLDLGAGAGFPGLVWKIARPGWTIMLVERREKPAAFLRRTTAVLGLERLEIVERDARRIERSDWDMVVSKAAGDFARLLPLVRCLVQAGALYVTAKGAGWRRELEEAKAPDFSLVGMRRIAPGRGAAIALRFWPTRNTRFT